jgi:protein-S-isoprenylcysteine O-methyltransferase Ste14
MIAWVNFAALLVSMFLFAWLYVQSVGPAALERKIGPEAYPRCARYRMLSMIFMFVASANYVLYYFFPLPVPLPRTFPWPWWASALVAAVIAIPSGYLVMRGVKDAGEEALTPKKEHEMFGGIYERIRHPQAWEAAFWFVFAFLLHSPMLAIVSVLGVVLEYWMVMSEERDLVIRFGERYEEYRQRTGAFWPRR